jgi:hypothetical protein
MTLESLKAYTPLAQIYTGLLQIPQMDDFVNKFQTFAPLISADITNYYSDNTSSSMGRIFFYVELYKNESAQFLYDYAVQNNIEPLIDSLMVTTLGDTVILSGKVAKVKLTDWFTFAAKVNNAQFKSFSTALSGDDVLVFFI